MYGEILQAYLKTIINSIQLQKLLRVFTDFFPQKCLILKSTRVCFPKWISPYYTNPVQDGIINDNFQFKLLTSKLYISCEFHSVELNSDWIVELEEISSKIQLKKGIDSYIWFPSF